MASILANNNPQLPGLVGEVVLGEIVFGEIVLREIVFGEIVLGEIVAQGATDFLTLKC